MKYTEELHWILDTSKSSLKKEDEYQQNIDFVHSLGLKCDSVGWSTLDLSNPRTDEILDAIEHFCKTNGWKARGVYTRNYVDHEGDWYRIKAPYFKDNTEAGWFNCEREGGGSVRMPTIRAYAELKTEPKLSVRDLCVPEKFRNACIKHAIADMEFCWIRDVGKYQAEQYFKRFCNRRASSIALCRRFDIGDRKRMNSLGGHLPRLSEIFYDLSLSSAEDCYLAKDMPEGGIAQAYVLEESTIEYNGIKTARTDVLCCEYLIHKSVAEILVREKVISTSMLHPIKIVDELPAGYTLYETTEMDRPTAEYMAQSIRDYENLKSKARPVHIVSEKEALKLLKGAKKERKEDFKMALPKAKSVPVSESEYAALVPYYLIANGGYLSDEYELFSYDDAIRENAELAGELSREELLADTPRGVVFAKSTCGDRIILMENGGVIRFSHEKPSSTEEWQSLAQFIVSAINE